MPLSVSGSYVMGKDCGRGATGCESAIAVCHVTDGGYESGKFAVLKCPESGQLDDSKKTLYVPIALFAFSAGESRKGSALPFSMPWPTD